MEPKHFLKIFLSLYLIITVACASTGAQFKIQKIKVKSEDIDSKERIVFSSHLTYGKNVDDPSLFNTDEKLAWVAKQAFLEMAHDDFFKGMGKNKMKSLRPGVMTALVMGKELYLSSSIKGGAFLYKLPNDDNNPMRDCLARCQAQFFDIYGMEKLPELEQAKLDHKNGASCGECMTFHQWYSKNKGKKMKDFNARVVTVRLSDVNDLNTVVPFDPCGTDAFRDFSKDPTLLPPYWGCNLLAAADDNKVHVVPEKKNGQWTEFHEVKPLPDPENVEYIDIECQTGE